MNQAILEADALHKNYPVKRLWRQVGQVRALQGVGFRLYPRRTLAVVGESGCGKSTLAKLVMGLESPTSGGIKHHHGDSSVQMIFQDPYGSLNPRKKAWQLVTEPLFIRGERRSEVLKEKARYWLEQVGLSSDSLNRYPHMFSGGQRQRLGIARALVVEPKVLLCDEPVSALDVSVQAQVLNLFIDLQKRFDLSYLFISHDLSVVRYLAHEVMVIYLGQVVEQGSRDQVFNHPQHPYTKALLAATPRVNQVREQADVKLKGEIPSRLTEIKGCGFSNRCPVATARCHDSAPEFRINGDSGHGARCHLV